MLKTYYICDWARSFLCTFACSVFTTLWGTATFFYILGNGGLYVGELVKFGARIFIRWLPKEMASHKNNQNLLTSGSHCVNSVMIRVILPNFSIDYKSGREREWILYQHKGNQNDLNFKNKYSLSEPGPHLQSAYVLCPWHSNLIPI